MNPLLVATLLALASPAAADTPPPQTERTPVLLARGLDGGPTSAECGPEPLPEDRCAPCQRSAPTSLWQPQPGLTCVADTAGLRAALQGATTAETICALPGRYEAGEEGLELRGAYDVALIGMPGARIQGPFDRAQQLVDRSEYEPPSSLWRRHSCLELRQVREVEVRGFEFRRCLGKAIKVRDAQEVWLDSLDIVRGWKAITLAGADHGFTAGQGDGEINRLVHPEGVRGVTVSHSGWVQDPSTGHDLWHGQHGLTWEAVHKPGPHEYLDGGFVFGRQVRGDIAVCRNAVSDAYNGVTLGIEPGLTVADFNQDVSIDHNTFVRTRDNVVEPEGYMSNWQVHHNVIFNAHAWISLQFVTGGDSAIYANVGFNDGLDYGGDPPLPEGPHDRPYVFKFADDGVGPHLDAPVWVFHNTWLWGGRYLNRTEQIGPLIHCNNRLLFQGSAEHGVSPPVVLFDVSGLPEDPFDPGVGFWHPDVRFSHDATNIFYDEDADWGRPAEPEGVLSGFTGWGDVQDAAEMAWPDRMMDVAPTGVGSWLDLAPDEDLLAVPLSSCEGFAEYPGGVVGGEFAGALGLDGEAQELQPAWQAPSR